MSAEPDNAPGPLFGVQLRLHELAGAVDAARAHAADADRCGRTAVALCRRARVEALEHCQRLAAANVARTSGKRRGA